MHKDNDDKVNPSYVILKENTVGFIFTKLKHHKWPRFPKKKIRRQNKKQFQHPFDTSEHRGKQRKSRKSPFNRGKKEPLTFISVHFLSGCVACLPCVIKVSKSPLELVAWCYNESNQKPPSARCFLERRANVNRVRWALVSTSAERSLMHFITYTSFLLPCTLRSGFM